MKRFVIILVVVIILAGGGYAFYRWRAQRQAASTTASFQTAKASHGNLVSTVGATGTVRSNQTADVSWKTSGTVETVNAKVGDKVKTGDVLAKLEQTSLPQTVILAQSDLSTAQKALEDLNTNAETSRVQALQNIATYAQNAKDAQYQLDNFSVPANQANLTTMDALDQMKKALDQARAAFEPYKYYPETDATRKSLKDTLDSAQSDFNSAVKRLNLENQLLAANANLDKARSDYEKWKNGPDPKDVAAAQAKIAAATATLKQAEIDAPFAGDITVAIPKTGDQVQAGTLAFRLDDLSTLYVDLEVSEIDINQIQVGQLVSTTFDAIPGKNYLGAVSDLDNVGTATQGVVNFTVTVKLTNPDKAVKPGMTAAANIIVKQLENVLIVPNRAVRLQNGKRVVYILRDNKPTPIPITLGATSDTTSQVVGGELKVGDLIVLNPPATLGTGGGGGPFGGGGGGPGRGPGG